MHDPHGAIRIFALAWLCSLGIVVAFGIAAYQLGTGERREAKRRSIRKSLNGSGWLLLVLTLKFAGYAFPRIEQHLNWLWIPAFSLVVLMWSMKGVRWLIRWRKSTRSVETSYTRAVRGASRRKL